LIITNRNNVYGHEKWKEKYPKLSRIIHKTDATSDADGVEIKLEGTGIWYPQDDLKIIHTPGNTAGALCVLYETGRENVLFTGHHLAYLESKKSLDGFKCYNEGNIEVFHHLLTYSLTHSLTHLLTHLLTHSLTHLLTHLLTYLLTYSLTLLGAINVYSSIEHIQ